MTPTPHRPLFNPSVPSLSVALLILGVAGRALAQAPTPVPDPTAPTTSSTSTPSSPAAGSTVRLDPFEVSETSDKGYGEVNSNSLTAFKADLAKLPVSADVFDQKFFDDTNLGNVEQTIQFFTAGAGSFSATPDSTAFNSQYLDRQSGTLSIRGLQATAWLVNGFFSVGGGGLTGTGLSSNFDLEKVEVINGPQALLYGASGAGGVVNLTTKQARLGTPAFGSFKFQTDQYGHKLGQIDYGAGSDKVALRVALVDQDFGGRRVFIGGPMQGAYVQVAVRPVNNTVIRISYDDQTFSRLNPSNTALALTAASTSNDARNGQYLNYLLATNQLSAAANGAPSGAGAIPGINWTTVDSLGGVYLGEYRHDHTLLATVDTTWNGWLSSQLAAGYKHDLEEKVGNASITYDAPNVSANPTGTFAVALGSGVASMLLEPTRTKILRFSTLADNQLFGGKVHSQTIAGADTDRADNGTIISSFYVLADSNWNPIPNTTGAANGYQIMPTQYFGVPAGPVQQGLYNPQSPRITLNGLNYVRATTNNTNSALISPANPEGLTGTGTGDFRHGTTITTGLYAANFSDFLGGDLTTLVGGRIGKLYQRSFTEQSPPNSPSTGSQIDDGFTSFNAGINVKVVGVLRAYAEISDDSNPSAGQDTVLGEQSKITKGLGEEVGLKATLPRWGLSGSLSVYHAKSSNETYAFTNTLFIDINPSGLNGTYSSGAPKVYVDRQSQGVQLTATATPGNWRVRISAATVDGTIATDTSYGQLYNDQFYENGAGQVTYADGAVVYVAPTYNSKGVIAAPASSAPAGYIPLTVAQMNASTSSYYANPVAINSQITPTSNVANVLKQVDPVHGAILTGATGLPISALQIAPNPASPPPGTLVVTKSGDVISGYPKLSVNFAAIYTVPTGLLKGLMAGGTGSIAWKTSEYYYYPLGVSVLNDRSLLYLPTEALFNGILGYSHKFRRVNFSTQLNINNVFNHYHVIILPNSATGWAGPNNATIDQQPRFYVWSSTIGF